MALNATALYTTEPVAQQVARKAAGEELTKFTSIFRAEVGKDQYTTRRSARRRFCKQPLSLRRARTKVRGKLPFDDRLSALRPCSHRPSIGEGPLLCAKRHVPSGEGIEGVVSEFKTFVRFFEPSGSIGYGLLRYMTKPTRICAGGTWHGYPGTSPTPATR
jgi:hypothetical protein